MRQVVAASKAKSNISYFTIEVGSDSRISLGVTKFKPLLLEL